MLKRQLLSAANKAESMSSTPIVRSDQCQR